jgi:hypothetical protein
MLRSLAKFTVGVLVVAVGYAVKRVGEKLQKKCEPVLAAEGYDGARLFDVDERDWEGLDDWRQAKPLTYESLAEAAREIKHLDWMGDVPEMREWLGKMDDWRRWN